SAAEVAQTLQRLIGRSSDGAAGSAVQVISLEELLRQRQEDAVEPEAPVIPADGTSMLGEEAAPRPATEPRADRSGDDRVVQRRSPSTAAGGAPWPSVAHLLAVNAIAAAPHDDAADED